MTKYFKDQ